jgi:hypothetical protein
MGNCCSCDAFGLGFFQKEEEPTPTPAFHSQKKGSRSARPEAAAVYTTVSTRNSGVRSATPDCRAVPEPPAPLPPFSNRPPCLFASPSGIAGQYSLSHG